VVPTAEEAGVYLAMHPDDPPMTRIRGLARIMTSPEAFERMLGLSVSIRRRRRRRRRRREK
jgi:mannonate dehydratase